MGKRSAFERRAGDAYPTPIEAVLPLIPHLRACATSPNPARAMVRSYAISNPSACAAPMPATSRPDRTRLPATASAEFRSSPIRHGGATSYMR